MKLKKLFLIAILLVASLNSRAQSIEQTNTELIAQHQKDSIRFDKIDNELRNYGKQNVITDKITLASIGIVIVGTVLNVKPGTMLVSNSICSFAILAISWKADLKLSKHKSKARNDE